MDFGDLKQLNFGLAITDLDEQRKKLMAQKAEFESQIAELSQQIDALRFIGNPEDRIKNITRITLDRAVSEILQFAFPIGLSTTEIQNMLMGAGFQNRETYREQLVSIQAIIDDRRDQINSTKRADGVLAYHLKVRG